MNNSAHHLHEPQKQKYLWCTWNSKLKANSHKCIFLILLCISASKENHQVILRQVHFASVDINFGEDNNYGKREKKRL